MDDVLRKQARKHLWAWLRPNVPALLITLLLMLLQSLTALVQPWLGGVLTDRLLLSQHLGFLLWLLFLLICAQQGLGYVIGMQMQKASGRLVANASAEIYAHLQSLPLAWHQEHRRGDVLALMTGDVYRLSGYVTGILLPFIPLLFTLAGALAMMFRLAPVIALAMAVLMPLMIIVLKLVGRRLRPMAQASAQAWADQSAVAAQNLELLSVIKASAAEYREAANLRGKANAAYAIDLRLARMQGAISPVVYVIGAGTVLLLLGLAGGRILHDGMRLGEMVSLFLYGTMLVSPIGRLAQVYGSTLAARGSVQRLLDALSTNPEVDTGSLGALPRDGEIRYQSVDFAYPGRPALFQGFDLRISAGETVALTGSNGAGKSTLVHMLMRLVEPQAGMITIGGVDVRDFRLAALRGQIALVAQSTMLFNATIAENIGYGHADAQQADIEKAARSARAHDFIKSLPDGYATVIGDQGVRLSGGQKQRISLARALLMDPAIFILDEATAMFDPRGEAEFVAECRDLLRDHTVLLVTHRPASLALADRILRLEGGQVHEVLVAS